MGLEVATFIADLVLTNPLGTDGKAQGDDHLRLLKSVLQTTFPSADRAFALTKHAEWSDTFVDKTTYTIVEGDLGKVILGDTTAALVDLTLPDPSTVGTGWGVIIVRKIAGTNALTIKRSGAELLNGLARDITLDIINDTVILKTDGTDWQIVSSHISGDSRLLTTGAADAYVLTGPLNVVAYYDGLEVKGEIHAANTGASTLAFNGLGIDDIVWPDGSAVIVGELPLGAKVSFVHDGTNWQLHTLCIPVVHNESTVGTEQATTSDTSKTFPGIPSGVKHVTIMFDGVSMSGTDQILLALGGSGGIDASGHVGRTVEEGSGTAWANEALVTKSSVAGNTWYGKVELNLMDEATDKWHIHISMHEGGTTMIMGSGVKSLASELTQLRLSTSGTDTFDAGNVNIVSHP